MFIVYYVMGYNTPHHAHTHTQIHVWSSNQDFWNWFDFKIFSLCHTLPAASARITFNISFFLCCCFLVSIFLVNDDFFFFRFECDCKWNAGIYWDCAWLNVFRANVEKVFNFFVTRLIVSVDVKIHPKSFVLSVCLTFTHSPLV